jgi:hypothetical protein
LIKKSSLSVLALFALILLMSGAACTRKAVSFSLPQEQRIGIAGFYQPASTSELLAGYMPENTQTVDGKILAQLDGDFERILRDSTGREYAGAEKSYQCVKSSPASNNSPAFEFWLSVGRCMNVDVILVPQLHAWQEREGGELGVLQPATVVMDFFLLDVKNKILLARSRFDETQQALTSNLLDIGKYISRGGKWISAEELAVEGMVKAAGELGL